MAFLPAAVRLGDSVSDRVSLPLSSVVADMNLFLDTDGDGEVNATDPDDDNDGIPDAIDDEPYSAVAESD